MKLTILILAFAVFSSAASAQNENNTQKSETLNILQPEFKGLDETLDLKIFIQEKLDYPYKAVQGGAEGTVVVRFKVLPSGELSAYKIINTLSSDCDMAVIDALKITSGSWYPGSIEGAPVAMEKELSVTFTLEGSDMFKTAQVAKSKGDHYLKAGKYNRAIKNYNRAIGSFPNNEITYYQRGLAKYYSGDMEGALLDFNRVAEMESQLADPMIIKLNEVVDYANQELLLYSQLH